MEPPEQLGKLNFLAGTYLLCAETFSGYVARLHHGSDFNVKAFCFRQYISSHQLNSHALRDTLYHNAA